MRNLAFLSFLLFTGTACNSNLLNGSAQSSPGQKPYKVSDKNSILSDAEMPDNLEDFLEGGLELIRDDIGDSEFSFEGLSFMNFETILSDALDFVQEEGLDVDMTEESPLFEGRSKDEIAEFISEFSLSYGEIDSEELSSSLKLQGGLGETRASAMEARFDRMDIDTFARRIYLVENGVGQTIPKVAKTVTPSRSSTVEGTGAKKPVAPKAPVFEDEAVASEQEPAAATSSFQGNVTSFFSASSFFSSWFD